MYNTLEHRDNFTKNFLISLGAHASVVLIAWLGGSTIMKIMNVNNNVEIIRSSVRVDVVGMPKFTVKELKAMQAEPVPAPEPEPQGAKVEEKPKDSAEDVIKEGDIVIKEQGKEQPKKSSFLNIISDYSSKKVTAKEKKKGVAKGNTKVLDSLILEGNRLSKGGALVGDYSDAEVSELSAYVQALPELVRVHFKLPSYLLDQNLKCKIAVYISPSGSVLKTELVESSGNGEYDVRAEKAIRLAAPFPAPNTAVAPRLSQGGIILKFPL